MDASEPPHLTTARPRIHHMREVERHIHSQNGSTRSVDAQLTLSHAMWGEEIGPDHDGLKRTEIEEELDLDLNNTPKTCLHHLKEADIVEEFAPPGPDTLVIATWKNDGDGEVVNGEVQESAEEGLDGLDSDLEPARTAGEEAAADGGGITKRSVLAAEFDLVPEKVENYLHTTSRPVDVLNEAVEAIEETDSLEVGDDYGEIAFINMPYRYRLTEFAVSLYEK